MADQLQENLAEIWRNSVRERMLQVLRSKGALDKDELQSVAQFSNAGIDVSEIMNLALSPLLNQGNLGQLSRLFSELQKAGMDMTPYAHYVAKVCFHSIGPIKAYKQLVEMGFKDFHFPELVRSEKDQIFQILDQVTEPQPVFGFSDFIALFYWLAQLPEYHDEVGRRLDCYLEHNLMDLAVACLSGTFLGGTSGLILRPPPEYADVLENRVEELIRDEIMIDPHVKFYWVLMTSPDSKSEYPLGKPRHW